MSLRDEILAALKASSDGVSGELLAREFGVSRTAVAKHIAALRRSGYEIEAHLGEGYVLLGSPDIAVPAEVRPLLHDPFWVRIEGGESTVSTNDDARALAAEGAPEGTVVVAARQSAGRGRLGRGWESPTGGAYLSAILRPQVSVLELGPLPLVVAMGVARGLESLGAQPQLKWPNDVELGGRKVAGILLEMSAQSDRPDWVVAGVGLNVVAHPRQPSATTLRASVGDVSAATAAAAALDGIAAVYRQWCSEGFVALETEFTSRHRLHREQVVVRDLTGAIVAEGMVVGIDDVGRLRVEERGVVRAVASGDVTLRS